MKYDAEHETRVFPYKLQVFEVVRARLEKEKYSNYTFYIDLYLLYIKIYWKVEVFILITNDLKCAIVIRISVSELQIILQHRDNKINLKSKNSWWCFYIRSNQNEGEASL